MSGKGLAQTLNEKPTFRARTLSENTVVRVGAQTLSEIPLSAPEPLANTQGGVRVWAKTLSENLISAPEPLAKTQW